MKLRKQLAQKAISENINPLEAINSSLVPAIELVGEKFGRKEYFLPDLMRSASAMKNALVFFEKEIKSGEERKSPGQNSYRHSKGRYS